MKSDAAIRNALEAGPRDVIDHLLVDAPPCDPDEERAIDTAPLSPTAAALRMALEHIDGSLLLDWTDKNVAAILELGGYVEAMNTGPAQGKLRAAIPALAGEYGDRVFCINPSEIAFVESPKDRDYNRSCSWHAKQYAIPPEAAPAVVAPELTDDEHARAEAAALDAAAEAAEAECLAAGVRAEAARAAASSFVPSKREAA